MTTAKVPYYRKRVECPVCRNVTENFTFKAKVVVPDKVESDNHVVSYHWIDKSYQECQPSFYALWVCTTCGYADFPDFFEIFLSTSTFEFTKLRDEILERVGDKNSVLAQLLSAVSLSDEGITFETALTIHLLAIYCYDVLIADFSDCTKLGRFYLRAAWLYRDAAALNLPPQPFKGFPSYHDFLKSLQPLWPTIPLDETAHLRKAAQYYRKIIYESFTFEDVVRRMKLIMLAFDIYSRLEDYKSAYEIAHSIVQMGIEMRMKLQHVRETKQRTGELSRAEDATLQHRMNDITEHLAGIHEQYDVVKKKWYTAWLPHIDAALQEYGDMTPESAVEICSKRNIPTEVINLAKMLDERFQEKKKKGFWGMFGKP